MEIYIYWFMLALALLGLEMVTGTFYMLVLSGAVALGGVAALTGVGLVAQLSLAGVAAVVGTLGLYRVKDKRTAEPDTSLDVGQPVRVLAWNEDGTARVHYRGTEWDAEMESVQATREGMLYIKAMQGSRLILTQHKL